MKKSLLNSIKITAALSLLLGVPLLVKSNKEAQQVSGYSSSSLPTTIDLNDTTETNIRSYYSSLNSLTTTERQGNNLLKNLKTILKNGQKYYSYENGTSIWQMYEITDRDWDKSPASSTTYGTYNPTTNKITGYTYGTSASSSKNNPYIRALYINRDVNNQTTAWDNHNQDQWGINREHVWPKAEGFDAEAAGGARGDPMHLMAGNGYANNIHSNYFYGYVKTSTSYTDCGSKYSNQSGNLRGTSKTLDSGTVFEPQDCDKGDIARAIFYMVARYNYLSGSDSDGINSNNPNLILTQSLSDWSSTGYTSTTSNPGKMGVLTDLLAWHHADPVDEYEKHRNNLLYTNFTNNRNPFIDFPEWADFIWGSVNYNGSTYISNDTTPTGYATPSSDTLYGYNSGGGSETVSVTGVSLNKNSTTITVDGAETLEATVAPSNATDKSVTWTSSNTSVATVSGGTVRGLAEGTSTITVKTNDGNYTAQCTVTVEASGGGGDIPETGSATINYNDTFSPALPSSKDTINSTDTSHDDTTSSFSFKEQGIYKGSSNSYLMFVENKGFLYNTSDLGTIDSVSATYASQTSTSGKIGVYFGSSQQSTYTTTNNQTIKGQSKTDTFTNTTEGNGFFQLSTSNKNVQITQIVVNYHTGSATTKTLTGITLDTEDVTKTFEVGDTFNYEELGVTANYSDGSSDVVTPTSVSSPDMSTAGTKTVTVSYTEGGVTETATYEITVNESHEGESGSATNPYTVAEARAAIDSAGGSSLDDKYTTGIVYQVDSYSSTYKSITYWISDDGTSSNPLQVYSGKGIGGADFSSISEISVGDTVVVKGELKKYNSTYEYNYNNELVSLIPASRTLSSIAVSGQQTLFDVGDEFTFGGTVTATYSNGSTADVTANSLFSGYDLSESGTQTVTVSYTEGEVTKTTSYTITVSDSSESDSNRIVSNINSSNYTNGSLCMEIAQDSASATLTCEAFTMVQQKNSSSSSVALTYDEIRIYSKHSLTVTPTEGYTLVSIILYADSAEYAGAVGGGAISNCTKTVSSTIVTLKPTDGTSAVSFTNSAQSRIDYIVVNYNAPIAPVSTSSYTLVKDATNLRTGDEIIFVSKYNSTYYNATTISGDYLRAETTTIESDIATKSSNALVFTIEKNGTNYNFYNSNLGYIRNNASQSAAVKTESTVSAYSTFSISINSTTGVSTITASSGNYKYFRFYRNSSTTYWFNFASSSSSYRDVYIYKKTTQVLADEWSQTFLNSTSDGSTCSVSNWSSLASSYKKLAETVQNEIINVDANASTDYSLRAQAMARYDFFMSDSRFNQGEHFIVGRASSSNARPFLSLLATEQNKSLFIVILCSIIGVSSIGCYYFIKFKKREE